MSPETLKFIEHIATRASLTIILMSILSTAGLVLPFYLALRSRQTRVKEYDIQGRVVREFIHGDNSAGNIKELKQYVSELKSFHKHN